MNSIFKVSILFLSFIVSAQITEQHIVVVTLMYNTGTDCIESLSSAFAQNYQNYHIIVVDDCSTNNSAEIVKNYIEQQGWQNKVHFIQNSIRRDVTANHELAVSLCNDNDIVIALDGDGDMFAHSNVLSYINKVYTLYPQTWMTYGSFIVKSTGQRIFHGPLPTDVLANRTVRRHDFITSHLRTFRAWLFKQVKHEDLLYRGNYPKYAPEIPFIFPMLEMAGPEHVRYIDEILYIYKDHSYAGADMALYHDIVRFFRSKPPYSALSR